MSTVELWGIVGRSSKRTSWRDPPAEGGFLSYVVIKVGPGLLGGRSGLLTCPVVAFQGGGALNKHRIYLKKSPGTLSHCHVDGPGVLL